MDRVEFLYLSQKDVIATGITMEQTIKVVEYALSEHGLGRFENPPKPGVHPNNAFIHAMPGYLPRKEIAGLKWISSFSGNVVKDIPSVMGLYILNDVRTGQPLSVMDCTWMTAMRTGGVSAVAAKFLALKDSRVMGIVGAGIQGRYNLLALATVCPNIELVKLFDTSLQAVIGMIDAFSKGLSVKLKAVSSPKEAIQGSQIVVTATSRLDKPIFKESWIDEGALVLPVHHRGWENRALQRADKFIVDDWRQIQQAHKEVGGFDGPLPKNHVELGEIITGKKIGRENDRQRIINYNYGLAIEDVAMAAEIFTRAKAKGLGTTLTLLDGKLPLC